MLGLKPHEQLLEEHVVILGKKRLKLLLPMGEGGREWRSRQPFALPLWPERMLLQITVDRRPFARCAERVLRQQSNYTAKQRWLARFDDAAFPIIAQLNKLPEEHPLKKDVMCKGVRCPAIMIANEEIVLQSRDLREGKIFEHRGPDILAEIAGTLFSQIQ